MGSKVKRIFFCENVLFVGGIPTYGLPSRPSSSIALLAFRLASVFSATEDSPLLTFDCLDYGAVNKSIDRLID